VTWLRWLQDLLTPSCPPELSPAALERCQAWIGPHPERRPLELLALVLFFLVNVLVIWWGARQLERRTPSD